MASITSPIAPSFQGACSEYVAGAGKHTYIVRLQAATERPVRLPSLRPTCPPGRVPLQRPSLRGGARHRWDSLLSNGPTELVWWVVNSQTSRRMLMLRPLPRASPPPGARPACHSLSQRLRSSWCWSFFSTHRTYPLPRHFSPLCKAIQVNPMPRCYLSRLRAAEACSTIDYQLVGGSTKVEPSATDCT